MAIASKTLITIGLKIVTPILTYAKSKLEKELFIYSFLRKYNIKSKIDSDFNSIYLETIYQLISSHDKDKSIIALFELDEIKDSFNEELYKKNNWTFKVSLNANIHTNPNLRNLKKIDINLDKEIEAFKKLFKEITNETRDPKEVEQNDSIKKIRDDVNELIDVKRLSEKFKTNIEISNQVLFFKSEPQPLSEHISNREKLIDSLIENFTTNKWIAIDGSISTGKSQLSVLLTQKLNKSTYWINLREFTSSNFLIKIYSDLSSFVSVPIQSELDSWLDKILNEIEHDSLIVLDDLPKLNFRIQIFNQFTSFVKKCKDKGILLLSTSNYELPSQIKDCVKEDFIVSLKQPFLDEEDVLNVILTYGLDDEKATKFKTLVHTLSSGHPTIVRAICEYLKQLDWVLSRDELTSIFNGDFSSELNESTYDILTKTITDENTRNLLYRLNVIIGSFTIDDVRLVGECSPEISNLIERFNSTVGLWIQRRDSVRFEISPLLKKLKNLDLSRRLEKQLNFDLGKSILEKKSLNQFDAQKAITHFIIAKSYNDAAFVLIIVLKEAVNDPAHYFESGMDKFWYKTSFPTEMDLALQLYIRTLQILLSDNSDDNLLFLINDLEALCLIASKKGINVGPAYLLLSTHYSSSNPQKSLNFLMTGNDQFEALIQTHGEKIDFNIESNLLSMVWGSSVSIDSLQDINHWFETISKLSKAQLKIINDSENTDFGSIFILKNLLNKEENKETKDQDWQGIISIFKNIQQRAKELKLDLLYANAIRYIINTYCDKIESIDDALKYAKEFIESVSENKTSVFLVNDAIGRQLFYCGRVADATPYLSKAINIDVDGFYTEKLDTYLVLK